ncbi:MAG: hypothetical protein A2Z07_10575 [Armatimonadetes bacterium RBG_16_67_12]|nr:MAG: hypothetical protein A2Z07_10575 [Armatimonadetes bacterium RBG_16_67_12]
MSSRRMVLDALDALQVLGRLAWLRRSQWYAPDRLRAFQESRLRHVVRHAYAHSPFYRRRFDAAGVQPSNIHTLDDLQRIPLLQRQDVADHKAEITADNARRYRPESGSTSGTTGARLEFIRDRQAIITIRAVMWRFEGWHGVRWKHRRAELRSNRHVKSPFFYDRSSGGPTMLVNTTDPGITREGAAAALEAFAPDVIFATSPTWLSFLSLHLIAHPERVVRPGVVFSVGERLFPEQRRLISEALGAPVVELYSTLEYVVAGGECERGRLHIASEMGIVEIVKNDQRCSPGEPGDLVLTSLWSRAFPFIRYAIGDIGYLETELCPCGRSLPTWRIVGGRHKDLVTTPKGIRNLPTNLLAEPRWREKIAGVRFLQESPDALIAQVVRGPAFAAEDTEALRAEVDAYFEGLLTVSVEFVDSIEQTAGGKYRFVVSRVSPLKG